jgi:catechol 2,3-dioxygenase-like lactoylglutathione lyase family enzyme
MSRTEGHEVSHFSRRSLIAGAAAGAAAAVLGPAMSAAAEPKSALSRPAPLLDGEVLGFGHTGIFQVDLKAAVEFYGNLLGLAPYQGPWQETPFANSYLDYAYGFPIGSGLYRTTYYIIPGNPNYGTTLDWLELFEVVAPEIGPEKSASVFRQAGYMHSFTVNDVRGLYRNLMKAGVKDLSRGGPVQIEPGRWIVHVADPSNVVVELVEPGGNGIYRASLR